MYAAPLSLSGVGSLGGLLPSAPPLQGILPPVVVIATAGTVVWTETDLLVVVERVLLASIVAVLKNVP